MGSCQNSSGDFADNSMESQRAPRRLPRQNSASNPFFQQDLSNGQNLGSKYNFHSTYEDKFIGECSVLEERSTANLYLCKELLYDDEQEYEEHFQDLEQKKLKLTHENILRIQEVVGKNTDGFFSTRKKIIVVLDYPFINLHREIANRTAKKIPFTGEEVRSILVSAVKGFTAIEAASYPVDKVRLRHIFFGIRNRESVIKVTEASLITKHTNYQAMRTLSFDDPQTKDIYLSPEQFHAWIHGYSHYQVHPKSGVFSLGMSLLDVCVMDPSREVYHFTEKKIDFDEIKSRIEISGKKYGGFIEKMLMAMLEPQIDKRSSFSELEQQLVLFKKNDQSKMHLSVIPSQKSVYINNDTTSLESNSMFKSVVSNCSMNRSFSSKKLKPAPVSEEDLEHITEHYTNGNKYIGQKLGSMKHGKGKYIFKDGSYYDGQWENNKISGKGSLYFSDQRLEYTGEWSNDEYNGWGVLYAQESENWVKYEGEFENGVRNGRGKMTFFDGTVYEGEFRSGKISGRGRKICTNGDVIEKNWDTVSPSYFLPDYR